MKKKSWYILPLPFTYFLKLGKIFFVDIGAYVGVIVSIVSLNFFLSIDETKDFSYTLCQSLRDKTVSCSLYPRHGCRSRMHL